MTQGFVQVAPDSTGKQLGNEVYTVPVGTTLTDGAGNQTVTSSPLSFFREHVINADPTNPAGVATVRNADGPSPNEFGLTMRLPAFQADNVSILAVLQDMATNIAALAGTLPGAPNTPGGIPPQPQLAFPSAGFPPGQLTPNIPRNVICDQFGRQIVLPYSSRDAITQANLTITASTSETVLLANTDKTVYNDLIAVIVANTSATATRVDISDQLAGPFHIPVYVPAGDVRGFTLGGVIIPQRGTAQSWTAQSSASVTDVRIWALFVQTKAA